MRAALCAVAGLLSFLILPSDLHACSCVTGIPICETFWKTDVVFAGEVVEQVRLETAGRPALFARRRVRFKVEGVYRGDVPDVVDVHTGAGGGDCGYAFRTGSTIVAGAQQPPRPTVVQGSRPFYLQAGPVLTRDIAGTPNHRVLPALAGYAMGVTAAAGYAYAPSAAVELELAWAGVVSTQQQFSYYWREDYRTENVDRFVNVLGRWTVPGTFISVVGGGGLLWTTLNQRDGVSTVFLPNRPPEKLSLPDQSVRYFALTLTGGVDAEIALSPRLRLVPGGRLRWVNRPVDGASASAGSGGYVFQLGVGLRAAF